MNQQSQSYRKRTGRRAFTLIEVVVSLLLLGVLFSGILVAYERTTDRIVIESLRNRAMGIAQRRMEMLISTGQEPNTVDMGGVDELDPHFVWRLDLRRVTPGMPVASTTDYDDTVIEAKVTVKYDSSDFDPAPSVELTRYFSDLTARAGENKAVPFGATDQEPYWMVELRQQYGDDIPLDVIQQRMLEEAGLPTNITDGTGN